MQHHKYSLDFKWVNVSFRIVSVNPVSVSLSHTAPHWYLDTWLYCSAFLLHYIHRKKWSQSRRSETKSEKEKWKWRETKCVDKLWNYCWLSSSLPPTKDYCSDTSKVLVPKLFHLLLISLTHIHVTLNYILHIFRLQMVSPPPPKEKKRLRKYYTTAFVF